MEHANDYVKDITFAFVKSAANRKVDDIGMSSLLNMNNSCSPRSRNRRRWKEGKEEGWKVIMQLREQMIIIIIN